MYMYFENQTFQKKNLKWVFKSNIFDRNSFLERFYQFSTLQNGIENQKFEVFKEVVHNFGKSDSDIM